MKRAIVLLALSAVLPAQPASPCQPCHPAIVASFAQTGMGRSFKPIENAALPEFRSPFRFYHAPSARYYEMSVINGRPQQRRWQLDAAGKEINSLVVAIDYVIGSGNHSKTYAHRAPSGKLIELPVSWYSDEGGHFAMSPGYDRPRHSDFQREIPDSCLFCHNGYPGPAGLAHGIDCARCHGDAAAHASGKGPVVNPAKLPAARQSEVCLQCHLESASRTIPDAIRHYGRAPFSYRPGEPLADFQIYFDRAQPADASGFTVNHSAYGLGQSKCAKQSQGRLTCVTCHDPHAPASGPAAAARYDAACGNCHSAPHPQRATTNCSGCHMPKRRAEDAVHVVMTDHRIRRTPEANLLASIPERHGRYDGPVKLLYPFSLSETPENALYQAVASLADTANWKANTDRLAALLEKTKPKSAGFYVALAETLRRMGQGVGAEPHYRRAIALDPAGLPPRLALAELLMARNDNRGALQLLREARTQDDATLLNAIALARTGVADYSGALAALRRAAELEPLLPITWLNMGVALAANGQREPAINAWQQALRLDPALTRAADLLRQYTPQPSR